MSNNIITNNDVVNGQYLCYSSLLFLLPSFGCYYCNIEYLGTIGLITTIFSINLWREFHYGWRRNCDLFFSRVMCLVATNYYILYSKSIYDIIYCILFIIIVVFFYNRSDFNDKKNWYKYHIAFHCSLSMIGIFTIYKINNFNKNILCY